MSARTVTARWCRWLRGSAYPTEARNASSAGDSVTLVGPKSPAGHRSSGEVKSSIEDLTPLAPPGDRPDPATDGELAVLVLQVSWALGDAAHDLPAGRVSAAQREELADTLQALGFIVRASAPGGASDGPVTPPDGGAIARSMDLPPVPPGGVR